MATAEVLDKVEPLYEVVDGQIVETPRMGVYEGWIASILDEAIVAYLSQHRLGRLYSEVLFWLDRSGKLKRRPDLAFVSYERWPRDRRIPREEAWDVVPDLAVEIISKTNTADEVVDKLAEYFRAGVRLVWVVYPSQGQVYVYSAPTSVRIQTAEDTLDGGDVLPGFRLPVARLFDDAHGDDGPSVLHARPST